MCLGVEQQSTRGYAAPGDKEIAASRWDEGNAGQSKLSSGERAQVGGREEGWEGHHSSYLIWAGCQCQPHHRPPPKNSWSDFIPQGLNPSYDFSCFPL